MSKWSELGPGFLSEGAWAIGQDLWAPDRAAFREAIRYLGSPMVLDVGFGSGIDADGIEREDLTGQVQYNGIDITPEFVERAQKKHPWGFWKVGDIESVADSKVVYDLIWCRHVLEHVEDGEKALKSVFESVSGAVMVSWFIRPTWTPSDVGCVDGNGFHHWTYYAPKWIEMIEELGGHLSRFDFDHHLTKCSVWLITNDGSNHYDGLHGHLNRFFGSRGFLETLIPPPPRVNEPMEVALDLLADSEHAFDAVIPVVERVDDLIWVLMCAQSALQTSIAYMTPRQDNADTQGAIRLVRDVKGQVDGFLRGKHDPTTIQAARDAQRRITDKLREAGRE